LVYLLDNQNQVLDRLSIGPELLMHIKRGEVSVAMALDRMADFADHIYSAKRFFEVLNTYSEGTRSRILSHPEDLLRISGRIQRVGISTLRQGDKVGLGFEIEALDGPKVILTQGRYDDVKRLQYALEGRTVFTWPQSEEGIP
jgi:hypothetical protein